MTDRPAIKPLEWSAVSYEPTWHYADGAGLRYSVFLHRSNAWRLLLKGIAPEKIGDFDTQEGAKAAAQSDFASRIRSCLLDKPEAVEAALIADLSALVRMLVRKCEKAGVDLEYMAKVRDFLKRKGLQGSPLRENLDKPEAVEGKPIICIGHHTISQLMAGNAVEIDAAIMIPASDLSDPEPGEHQEVLDAIAAHNSGEEE